MVKSIKSLGSHDLSLQFTFHASELLVLGSEAPWVPPPWICLSTDSCVTSTWKDKWLSLGKLGVGWGWGGQVSNNPVWGMGPLEPASSNCFRK